MALVEAMAQDLATQRALTGPRRLVSVFFGGGTPSLLAPEQVARLLEVARGLWTADAELEVSLEANPTDAEAARFSALAQAGVNRLSLGVQALDDAQLRFLGRDHDAAAGRRAVETALRTAGRVSLDLIYALPGQDRAQWRAALGEAAALGAEHVSPYQLTVEPGTAFHRAVRRGRWTPAEPDLAADLYEATQEVLGARGFHAYEVSNHARGAAAEARHNLVYWRGWDYAGAGPGAHGRLTIDGQRRATETHAEPTAYVSAVAERGLGFAADAPLSPVAVAEERLLMGMRTHEGVALEEVAATGLAADDPRLRDYAELGLLTLRAGRICATAAGRRVLDRLTAELAGAA